MVAVRFLFFLMSLSGSGFLLATESPSALDSDLPMSPASYCSEEEESDDEKKLPRKSKFRSSMAILQEAKLREEIQSQKQQDLESAITRGSLEDLVAAVESGAEINKRCYDKKRTAVHLAVKHGDFSMVSYLVQKQQERKEAEYNKRMEPFLEEEEESLTVEEGEADDVRVSEAKKAEPTIFPLSEKEKKSFLLIKDYDGRTPFHLGLVKYYKKWKEISQQTREASDQIIEKKRILEFLLESYDKVLLEADSSKQTPFHLAAKAGDVDSISVFLAKVSQDEIINSFDMKGQTALSYAVRVKSRAVEELLMRRIPEVAEHLNDPKKVFFLAVKSWRADAVNHLCSKYSRSVLETKIRGESGEEERVVLSTVDGNNNTVLHWLILSMAKKRASSSLGEGGKENQLPVKARDQDIRTLVALLKNFNLFAQDYIDLQNLDGDTALHLAVKKGVLPAVRILLGYEASTLLRDNEGNTLFSYLKKIRGKSDLNPHEYKIRELIKDEPRTKFKTIDKLHKWFRSLKNKEVQKEIIRRLSQ